ncbi:MAG: hypothetical protein CMJ74_09810 [Planctomycetaceae bacterium]|nr:hypothetical protein [Planctomycetaceae bacterium]|tara:strand:+ start:339 stop:587 length:249 start_codon:yes stop_codon:yes gene_type:complete
MVEYSDLREFLKWCLIINAGILLFWYVVYVTAGDTIYRIQSRWFKLTEEKFASIHYRLIAQYKIAVIVLNLVPWIALLLMRD